MTKFAPLRLAGMSLVAASLFFSASAPAQAGSATGTIGVSLTITSACVVNAGTAYTASLGNIGNIAFTSQPGLFGTTYASAVAQGGTGPITLQCSPGSTPSMTIGAGANDAGGVHRMSSGTNTVAYHLYSDSAHTNEIAINQSLTFGTATTAPISVPIYAGTTSGGSVLAAGAYTDTVNVTLNF